MNQEPQSPANAQRNSEAFGKVPNHSESFRTVPNDAEVFGTIPHVAERKGNHSLTVREVARLFETAGVARTERSIVNWCQPNKAGVARLDAYFDPNERKYYLTPESVERAIAEEKAKANKHHDSSESLRNVPKLTEEPMESPGRIKALEQEILDLKITNKGKDFFIEQLQKEKTANLEQLVAFSRKVGELETKLVQISPPPQDPDGKESPARIF